MIERAEEDAKQLAQIHVIRRFIKSQAATIIQIHIEFRGKAFAKQFDCSRHFLEKSIISFKPINKFKVNLFADFLVLLLLIGSLQSLPTVFDKGVLFGILF